ncbi:MAG: hypothetical protein WBA93_00785, partial [Microcoleaceae cyanobacterium]
WKNQINVSEKLGVVIDKMVFDYWRNRYQNIDEVMDKLKGVSSHSGNSSTLNSTLVSNPQTTPVQSLIKIGLGIGFGVIFAFVIIANIFRREEKSSLSSTTNNQNEEALFKPSPTTSLSKTTESSVSVSEPWYSAIISAQTAAQKALTAQTKSEWDAVASDWQKAVNLMKEVQESDPNYQKAKDRIPVYQNNVNVAKQRAAQAPIQEIPSPSPIMNNQSLTKIELDKPGLYLATTTLKYDDGDVLKGDFRVYCPTSTIRPTNYVLLDKYGHVKKQGQWWESAFEAQYLPEKMLITLVCHPKS